MTKLAQTPRMIRVCCFSWIYLLCLKNMALWRMIFPFFCLLVQIPLFLVSACWLGSEASQRGLPLFPEQKVHLPRLCLWAQHSCPASCNWLPSPLMQAYWAKLNKNLCCHLTYSPFPSFFGSLLMCSVSGFLCHWAWRYSRCPSWIPPNLHLPIFHSIHRTLFVCDVGRPCLVFFISFRKVYQTLFCLLFEIGARELVCFFKLFVKLFWFSLFFLQALVCLCGVACSLSCLFQAATRQFKVSRPFSWICPALNAASSVID